MADDPDNIVLVMLRDIRGKLDEHDKRFDAMDEQFRAIDKQFDGVRKEISDLQTWTRYAMGLGMTNDLKMKELEVRIAEIERLRPEPQ